MGESTISMAIFNGYVCLPEGKQNHWTLRWFMALSENNVPKTSHGFKKIICFALKIAIWVHIFCDKPKLGKNLADPALSNCRPLKAWNFEMKRAENAQTANPRCCPWLICTYIIMYIWRFEIDSNGCTCSFPMFSLAILISPIRTFFSLGGMFNPLLKVDESNPWSPRRQTIHSQYMMKCHKQVQKRTLMVATGVFSANLRSPNSPSLSP